MQGSHSTIFADTMKSHHQLLLSKMSDDKGWTTSKSGAGFSLIEMIVSTSVFIVVMLIVVGAMISLDNASRKARAIRVAMDNISAATDSMSRNIRMGSYYHCGCGDATLRGAGDPTTPGDMTFPDAPRDCPMSDVDGNGGDQCVAFISQQDDHIVYQLKNGRIQRSRDGGNTFIPLTAPEITVKNLHFFVNGTQPNAQQPVVTILLGGEATLGGKVVTNFNLETTLGSRTPNYSTP